MRSGILLARRSLLGCVALLLTVAPARVRAQSGYQGYPVAPRGLGMGGTLTALGEGSASLYYNPAAVASGPRVRVQMSGSLYGLLGGTQRDAYGQNVSYRYMAFQVIPANLSMEVHGLKLGKLRLSNRWGFGVSILAPYSFKFSSVTNDRQSGSLVLRKIDDLTYSVYAGAGYQIASNAAVGVSLVAVYRNIEQSYLVQRDQPGFFLSGSGEQSLTTVGHTLAFGVRYSPRPHLWLGVGLHLPLQHLFSFNSREATRTAVFVDGLGGATSQRDVKVSARFVIPLRLNLGLGWQVDHRWAIAIGVQLWMPHTYNSAVEQGSDRVLAVNRHAFTANASIGLETWVRGGRNPIRFGFYTDHSPLTKPTLDSGLGDKVDLYGGTFSIGFRRTMFDSEVGLIGVGGPTRAIGFDLAGGTLQAREVQGVQWRVFLGYATALNY